MPRVYHRDGIPIGAGAGASGALGRRTPARHERRPGRGPRGARGHAAWLVGGAVRDRLLGRETADVDVVVDGDPAEAARAVARAGAAAPPASRSRRSSAPGAWSRATARWQVDVEPLRGGTLEADLALRDFTVNAIAEPLAGGAPIDPLGGPRRSARPGACAMAGPAAFADDPLRVLRLVRVAVELELEPDAETVRVRRRARATGSATSRPSACSWSCAGSSPRRARAAAWR